MYQPVRSHGFTLGFARAQNYRSEPSSLILLLRLPAARSYVLQVCAALCEGSTYFGLEYAVQVRVTFAF